jgi:protein phosphatase PTC1
VIKDKPELNMPEALNHTFMNVDKQLGETKGMFSGCTAVVAFMKVESRVVDNVSASKVFWMNH